MQPKELPVWGCVLESFIKSVLMRYVPGNPISRIIPYSPSFESVFSWDWKVGLESRKQWFERICLYNDIVCMRLWHDVTVIGNSGRFSTSATVEDVFVIDDVTVTVSAGLEATVEDIYGL